MAALTSTHTMLVLLYLRICALPSQWLFLWCCAVVFNLSANSPSMQTSGMQVTHTKSFLKWTGFADLTLVFTKNKKLYYLIVTVPKQILTTSPIISSLWTAGLLRHLPGRLSYQLYQEVIFPTFQKPPRHLPLSCIEFLAYIRETEDPHELLIVELLSIAQNALPISSFWLGSL